MKKKSTGYTTFLYFLCQLCFLCARVFSQSAAEPVIEYDKKGKPNWITNPGNVFAQSKYFYGVGSADNSEKADALAFADLIKYFSTSVHTYIESKQTYIETNKNNKVRAKTNDSLVSQTNISASMSGLAGSRILGRWEDAAKKKYYSLAVLEKGDAVKYYSKLLDANIESLKNIEAVKDTGAVERFKRYQRAGEIAEADKVFAVILLYAGGPDRIASVHTGIDYKGIAANIADSIVFETGQSALVKMGDTFEKRIQIKSSMFKTIGAVNCLVTIEKKTQNEKKTQKIKNKNEPVFKNSYALNSDNALFLQVPTDDFLQGLYSVNIEMILGDNLQDDYQNPRSSFLLDIKPADTVVRFEGSALSALEKSIFVQSINESVQNNLIKLKTHDVFLIAYNEKKEAGAFGGGEILLCDVSVSLLKNESMIYQSEAKRIVEIERSRTIKLAAIFIRENEAFWKSVKEALEK